MAKKVKQEERPAAHTIRLGGDRKDRIENYRAKKQLEGTPVPNLELAVNQLLDKALELEQV